MHRHLLAAALLALLFTPSAAHATCDDLSDPATMETYRGLINDGVSLTRDGKPQEAIEVFKQAQAYCALDPTLTYALARAHYEAGECDIAVVLYEQAIVQLATTPVAASIDEPRIRKRLAEAQSGCATRYQIDCADTGVSLTISGAEPVPCPASAELDQAATLEVVASRDGFIPHTATLDVAEGGTATLTVPALEVAPTEDSDGDGVCDPAFAASGLQGDCVGEDLCMGDLEDTDGHKDEDGCPDPDNDGDGLCDAWVAESGQLDRYPVCLASDPCPDAAPGEDGEDGCPAAPGSGGGGSVWGWVALGTGLALAGGGAAAFIVAGSIQSEFDDASADGPIDAFSMDEAQDKIDTHSLMNTLGIAGVSVGGALLATGVVVLLLDGGAETDSVSFGPTPDGGLSLGWSRRF